MNQCLCYNSSSCSFKYTLICRLVSRYVRFDVGTVDDASTSAHRRCMVTEFFIIVFDPIYSRCYHTIEYAYVLSLLQFILYRRIMTKVQMLAPVPQ